MTEDKSAHSPALVPGAKPLRVVRLPRNAPTPFEIAPGAEDCAVLAGFLGIDKLRKLRFAGQITPAPGGSWELHAHLGATVVQPCSVTLAQVTTRIEEEVVRRYLRDMPTVEEGESEMPEDADAEPLAEVIDPGAVMIEALALALPPFPRAEGAELGEAVFTKPGKPPLRDEDTRPLAGLAQLRDKLSGDKDGQGE
ncbi:YceD family protein [Alkalilacustris brevis]|uniref:YceD family protein n=1 Tax=Alkalilacustris brevis TaxID=2026338 RepID=UPI000E0D66FF|nr:DUF177 domain-containing protein [Alkalilacustris brevis]